MRELASKRSGGPPRLTTSSSTKEAKPVGATHDESTGDGVWLSLGITLGKVALFVALMLVVGTRLFPWLLQYVERTKSRELCKRTCL